MGCGALLVRGRLPGYVRCQRSGISPARGRSPVLVFAGQSERHSITEGDRKGIVVVLRDQNSLMPFVQGPCHGDGHGFIELAFHARMVSRGDRDWEVNSGFHMGPTFSCLNCVAGFQELPLTDRGNYVNLSGKVRPVFAVCFLPTEKVHEGLGDGVALGGRR